MALSTALEKVAPGAGSQHRQALQRNFDLINIRVPRFDPTADNGKVLKIVGGVPTWAADAVA